MANQWQLHSCQYLKPRYGGFCPPPLSLNMYIIVGLGNPGERHRCSRHNLGFRCVDFMSREWQIPFSERRAKAVLARGRRHGQDVVLVKPRTFMNNSGEGISYLVDRCGVRPSDILVIYDDWELAIGRMRIRTQGSGGSHNGMRSIVSAPVSYTHLTLPTNREV